VWTDGQIETDITKLIVAFRNFANALKNEAWALPQRPTTNFSIYSFVN